LWEGERLGIVHDAFNVHAKRLSPMAAVQEENIGCEKVLSGFFA
jgi:hypothetical protein